MAKNKMIQYKKNDVKGGGGGDVILFKSDLPGPQWLEGGGECCRSECETVTEADNYGNTTTRDTK